MKNLLKILLIATLLLGGCDQPRVGRVGETPLPESNPESVITTRPTTAPVAYPIVFVEQGNDGRGILRLVSSDGANARTLTSLKTFPDWATPRLTTTTTVVFSDVPSRSDVGECLFTVGVQTINIASGIRRDVTGHSIAGRTVFCANSRDTFALERGTAIVFAREFVNQPEGTRIWRTNADGAAPKQLTLDPGQTIEELRLNDTCPVISHDKHNVYFLSERKPLGIWRVSIEGGEPRLVLKIGFTAQGLESSPNGERLLFTAPTVDGSTALVEFTIAASTWSLVNVQGLSGLNDAGYLPDGAIVTRAQDASGSGLFVIQSDRGAFRRIIGHGITIHHPRSLP